MNVLSIDFDIIMAPTINLYNHFIDPNSNCTITDMIENYPLLNGYQADFFIYQKLVLYILEIIKDISVEDIYVSTSHAKIFDFLQNEKNVSIFHIDHHHDMGYDGNNYNICSCSNWCKYLYEKNIISNVLWIKNINSEFNEQEFNDYPYFEYKNFFEIKNLNKEIPKIDKIFLCLSPEWVPENYHCLFYLILDLINKEKQCFLKINR